MIDEEQLISYFENLAINSRSINHTLEGRDSFFYIESPDDTEEFDKALRNTAMSPTFMLVADQGELNDNDSENHTQELNVQFYVIAKTTDELSIREARAFCLPAALDFLAKIKKDAKKNKIIADKKITFRIDKIPYQKVGPMNVVWYGYTLWITFICPFGYAVTTGSWREV